MKEPLLDPILLERCNYLGTCYLLINDEGYLTPYDMAPRLQHAKCQHCVKNGQQESRTTSLGGC